ncbi:MAG: TRAP transporter small permease [Oscillospiraceae bacterium]|nr:TRAP transporter small permease [Oscillospiraceae bacterium]
MNKILDYIEESLVCVCLIVMTSLTFVNVVSRYVFSASLSFSEEITTYLFVLLSLLGAAIAAKRGAHLGLSILTDRVGPKTGRALGIISMLFSTVFSAIICYYGVFMALNQYNKGQLTAGTQLPEWIFGSFVPIGALFVTIRFAQNLFRLIAGKEIQHEDVVAEALENAAQEEED